MDEATNSGGVSSVIRRRSFVVRLQPPRRGQHLRDDLAGGQIARQPGLARRAEDAAHRAAGLRADADGAALPG